MDNIDNILSFYKNKIKNISSQKENILRIINNIFISDLKTDDLKISNSILYIKSSPKIKLGILLKKESLLNNLKEELSLDLKDIR